MGGLLAYYLNRLEANGWQRKRWPSSTCNMRLEPEIYKQHNKDKESIRSKTAVVSLSWEILSMKKGRRWRGGTRRCCPADCDDPGHIGREPEVSSDVFKEGLWRWLVTIGFAILISNICIYQQQHHHHHHPQIQSEETDRRQWAVVTGEY